MRWKRVGSDLKEEEGEGGMTAAVMKRGRMETYFRKEEAQENYT